MALCAVLSTATPAYLANFTGQGKAQEALVDALLGNTMLMRDMLVAGGAQHVGADGKPLDGAHHYGEAMSIYTQIIKASAVLSDQTSTGGASAVSPPTPWDDRSQIKEVGTITQSYY